ncbi:HNH endonuclease [Streptomyces sp. NPDC003077]|uniref:HNH endonuclease n=1 Tax=Streptomyces sp. NPDC003077 TaxID=3154443 RepID=UPI0033AA079B
MIPIPRAPLDDRLAARLEEKSRGLRREDGEKARAAWRGAKAIRHDLKIVLGGMAFGFSRCMYCGDGQGTDIDHLMPLAHDARHVFSWSNHFLACSHCNSNEKRDHYPVDEHGRCLLIDPCREDPYDHLALTLATGRYAGRTAKGEATLRVFGLGRPVLEQGRSRAYVRCKSMLRDWARQMSAGEEHEAAEVLRSLQVHPFGDVLYAIVRRVDAPGAAVVFGGEVVDALRHLRPVSARSPLTAESTAPAAPAGTS